MDGTLCDTSKIIEQSLQKTLVELSKINRQAAENLNISSLKETRNLTALDLEPNVSHERIRLEAFKRSLESVGIYDKKITEHVYEFYMKHRFDDNIPYPDVKPVLDYLKGRYILGVISNGNSYPERIGLKDYFDIVILSQDFGFRKPDSRIFKVALRKADCESYEVIHIGDSLEDDVQGANEAGIISVYLNRKKTFEDSKANFTICSLVGLQNILDNSQ